MVCILPALACKTITNVVVLAKKNHAVYNKYQYLSMCKCWISKWSCCMFVESKLALIVFIIFLFLVNTNKNIYL